MKKKGLSIIVIGALMVSMLSGCGTPKEVTENVTLLELAATNDYTSATMAKTAERYASENNLLYKKRPVKSDAVEDVEAEVLAAVEAGTDVIVCSGTAFEIPIYQLQGEYKNTKFVIVDGAPRKEEGKKLKVRKNTEAIMYAEEQGGFLAGYAAVKDGYMNLGFIGGIPNENVVRYGSGFVQGANYAAEEMGLDKDKIIVRFTYLGTNEMSPALMEMAGQWYDDGVEIIFASGGTIGAAVMRAAEQKDKKVIGVDCDQSSESDSVVVSVVKQIDSALYSTLASIYNDEFKGKKAEEMNVASGGIALSMEKAKFNSFTQQDYATIIDKMGGKDLKISKDEIKTLQGKKDSFANITLNIE